MQSGTRIGRRQVVERKESAPRREVRIESTALLSTSFRRSQVFYRRNSLFLNKTSLLSLLLPIGPCYAKFGEFFAFGSIQRIHGLMIPKKIPSKGSKQDVEMYKHTIDLPKTSFGLRANSIVREPEIQKLWEENEVFKRAVDKNTGGTFILHDGPPYANGKLHMGHALNKILKDIIIRYMLLQNFKVKFVPGWDCHGLPIELKAYNIGVSSLEARDRDYYVLQSMNEAARKDLTPLTLREIAAKFAKDVVDIQMKSFKRYGVWAEWNNPYLTLSPEYEAAQIELFGQMATKGYIYRGRKPVHWSPSSRTALAEAELEYPDGHVSTSIYAILKMVSASPTSHDLLEEFFPNLFLAIWTTTPWTIPANAAIAVNPTLVYGVAEVHSALKEASSTLRKQAKLGRVLKKEEIKPFIIVAFDLVPTLESKWGVKLVIKKTFNGTALENCRYLHPLDGKKCPVVFGGDYISIESGTGLVHTAPGHGQEDYITGLKYGLPILSPVDDSGNFTEETGQFSGLNVMGDGNTSVVKFLDDNLLLLLVEPYEHKYPYDWRTKKPTIFRATEQWFASVEGFRQAAIDAINMVNWIPSQAVNRITAMTASRSDWCISRQRAWGVPIPVFYHVDTMEPLITEETISHIKAIISEKGSDAWWYMPIEELLPEKFRSNASKYQRGADTMDVWFDSGSSWAAVLGKGDGMILPADLCLEGTDQHRGWFQSSLITSVAATGKPPFSSVVTHGFVLDEKGLKMSKSLGNVVDPEIIISGGKSTKDEPCYGADTLRLWVSSVDYTGDVLIGPQTLRQISDSYRKLRGTLRFLLSNLHDWNPGFSISYGDLPKIDQHALLQLENVVKIVKDSYDSYQFYKVFQILQRFVIVDLSSFYFDVAKDRLYVGGSTSFTRRCCQTVLASHFLSIVLMIAPILPHLAEDAWQNLPFEHFMDNGSSAKYVFDLRWPDLNKMWLSMPVSEANFWGSILELKSEVNKVLELARGGKLIGSSLEAKVYLHTSDALISSRLQEMCGAVLDADSLHRIFITSQVEVLACLNEVSQTVKHSGTFINRDNINIWIGVCHADGEKCERCWNYSPNVGMSADHPTLCFRCCDVIRGWEPVKAQPQIC